MQEHGGNFGTGVIDFSVNTNPCVTETMILELVRKHAGSAAVYPEIDGKSLLEAVSENIRIDPERLILGNGATDCLYRAVQLLKPKTALIIEPTFSEYRQALENNNCQVVSLKYPLNEAAGQIEKGLLNQIKKIKAELVVLCSPNNPTGHKYGDDFIRSVTEIQKIHKGYLMVDESFRFFEPLSSCYRKEAWNLLVLTSLTKYYGIPGLRIGYLSGNFSLIAQMKKKQMPWNLNGLAIEVTKELMMDQALWDRTANWYCEEKAYMVSRLGELKGLNLYGSKSNFLLCRLDRFKGSEINRWLLEQEKPMGIRTCSSFEGLSDSFIRIGLKDHDANEKLIGALENYWRIHSE